MQNSPLTDSEMRYSKELERLPSSVRSRMLGWVLELAPGIALFAYGMATNSRVFILFGFLSQLYFTIWRMYAQFRGFRMQRSIALKWLSAINVRPAKLNLIVLRSLDIDRAVTFYRMLGLVFTKHCHGNGSEHYSSEIDGVVFEVYPLSEGQSASTSVRVGFNVDDVDSLIPLLVQVGAVVVSSPRDCEWGRKALVRDLDGHAVELVTTQRAP